MSGLNTDFLFKRAKQPGHKDQWPKIMEFDIVQTAEAQYAMVRSEPPNSSTVEDFMHQKRMAQPPKPADALFFDDEYGVVLKHLISMGGLGFVALFASTRRQGNSITIEHNNLLVVKSEYKFVNKCAPHHVWKEARWTMHGTCTMDDIARQAHYEIALRDFATTQNSVVPVLGCYQSEHAYYLMSELQYGFYMPSPTPQAAPLYCSSLHSWMQNCNTGAFEKRETRQSKALVYSIVRVGADLHDCEVAHHDLKPTNVLLVPVHGSSGLELALKVVDLGQATSLREAFKDRPYGTEKCASDSDTTPSCALRTSAQARDHAYFCTKWRLHISQRY